MFGMWEHKCPEYSLQTSCYDFSPCYNVQSLKHQRMSQCTKVSANILEHLLPLDKWVFVCAGEFVDQNADFLSLPAIVDTCSSHTNAAQSLIWYYQRVVKKTKWFPQRDSCMTCSLHSAVDTCSPPPPPLTFPTESLPLWCSSNSNWGKRPDKVVHPVSWTSPVSVCESGFNEANCYL